MEQGLKIGRAEGEINKREETVMKTKVKKITYIVLIVLLLVLIAVVLFRGKKEDNEVSNPQQETIIQNDTEKDTKDTQEKAPSSIELPFVPAGP